MVHYGYGKHIFTPDLPSLEIVLKLLYIAEIRDIRIVLCEALSCPIFVKDRRPAEVDAMGTDHHHRYPGMLHNLSHCHLLRTVPTNRG